LLNFRPVAKQSKIERLKFQMKSSRSALPNVRFVNHVVMACLVLFGWGSPRVWAGKNVWTSSGPLRQINALAADPQNPQTIYAGDAEAGGVFKTTNGGRSWSRFMSLDNDVSNLVVDPQNPNVVYVASRSGGGLFKVTDGKSERILRGVPVLGVAINPQNPDTIYVAAGLNNGVLRSTDGGKTWVSAAFGFFSNREVLALTIDTQTPTTMYAADGTGVFKTVDGGANWRSVKAGPTTNGILLPRIIVDPANSDRLYALIPGARTGRFQVFISPDAGNTWDPLDLQLPADIRALEVVANDTGTLYASTTLGGVFRTDAATTWTPINSGLANSILALAVDPQNAGTVYAGTWGNGLFKSTDAAENWVRLPRPRYVNRLAIDPQTSTTVYANTIDGVFKSTDGGTSGTKPFRSGPLDRFSLRDLVIDPQNPKTLYAGFNTYWRENGQTGLVFKTVDGGINWDQLQLPENFGFGMLAVDPQIPEIVYVTLDVGSGDYRLFRSLNGGLTWNLPPADLKAKGNTWGAAVTALGIDPLNSETIYAAADQYNDTTVLWKSTDGGKTWLDLEFHAANFVNAIVIDSQKSNIIYIGTNRGVLRSTDAGANWTPMNAGLPVNNLGGLPEIQFLAIDPQNPARVYAVLYAGGVFAITVDP
jgi:photosystem II stability/assembly factor-like uncharacterized protein